MPRAACISSAPTSCARSPPAIARRAVSRTPGEIDRWPGILDRALGLVDRDGDGARAMRTVRYDDEHGQAQGFAAYRIAREANQPGFVECDFLVAATDDAERALWRFLIEQDFVTGVRARLRSVDEPLPWLLEDPQGGHALRRRRPPVGAHPRPGRSPRRPPLRQRRHPRARGDRPPPARGRSIPAGGRRSGTRRGRADRAAGCRADGTVDRARRAGARRDLPRRGTPVGARSGRADHGAAPRRHRCSPTACSRPSARRISASGSERSAGERFRDGGADTPVRGTP